MQVRTLLGGIVFIIAVIVMSEIQKSETKECLASEYSGKEACEETSEVETSIKKVEIIPPAEVPPSSFGVVFENQSGKKVELYWDDGKDGVLQGQLRHTDSITINTYIGHKFFFVEQNNKKNKLYETTMYEHVGNVVLYDSKTMKERDRQFEHEKQIFYKEYFQKNGRRWSNYYPRKPVAHHYYKFSNIGEKINIKSAQSFFFKCDENDIPLDISTKLINEENEWLKNHKIHDIVQIHPFNETNHNKSDETNWANVGGINPIASFEDISDKYHIARWNKTFYCRNIVNTEPGHENNINAVKPQEFEMEVLCTSPNVVQILNFLSDDEIDAIKNSGLYNGLKRSTVTDQAIITKDRTSSTVWIDRSDSIIIDNVIKRVADIIKIDESKLYLNTSAESLQLVHYFPGELYKPHVDYGTDRPHNRYITFLIYLNDVQQGGYTSFAKADPQCKDENNYFGVKPIKGSVAWFYNLLPDGNVDELSQHYAEPPINCEKWMSNLWIWDEYFTR